MSVTVCRAPLLHPVLPEPDGWLSELLKAADVKLSTNSSGTNIVKEEEDEDKQRLDIWSSIQNSNQQITAPPPAYIHPLVRQSSSLMSQNSLEICTESLGSETGSYDFSSGDHLDYTSETGEGDEETGEEETGEEMEMETQRNDLSYVNYHCCVGRRSPVRSFPPPLPSISRRNGHCLKMHHRRQNGRLVLEAVHVPSNNYLHAERHEGRLLLSFIDTQSPVPPPGIENEGKIQPLMPTDEKFESLREIVDDDDEDEEEELEVVDRGTTVEVKVSMAMAKIHRSSLVINKFVVGSPLPEQGSPAVTGKRMNTASAAAVASSISTLSSTTEGFQYNYLQQNKSRWGPQSPAAAAAAESKLLFTSKGRNREELLHDMRRCSGLRRPLFIFEQPFCIATS